MKKNLLFITVFVLFITMCSIAQTNETFKDTRDSKVYKTVKVGTQTWMAENLNYAPGSGSWCYDNNASNCTKYGRLYNWNTARDICPKGWVLPSQSDFELLLNSVGGSGSKSYHTLKEGGSSGFSALFGGWRYNNGSYYDIATDGYWWSSSDEDDGSAWILDISGGSQTAEMRDEDWELGFSVRCLKDLVR